MCAIKNNDKKKCWKQEMYNLVLTSLDAKSIHFLKQNH